MGRAGALRRPLAGARNSARELRTARRMRRRLRSWQRAWPEPPPLPRHDRLVTTIVVPCYNHASFLPYAVQSLVEQTLPTFDTVFVDDCSVDVTPQLLPSLAERLKERGDVTVLRHETNRGQAASLNTAIAAARTPLVTVLNDDDWLVASSLELLVGAFADHGPVALVGAASQWFTGDGRPPRQEGPPSAVARRIEPAHARRVRAPSDLNMTHSGMTVVKAAWHVVDGYFSDPSRRVVEFSDRDFQLRVATLYPVVILDTPLVWWRSDSSVDAGRNS